jgi:hypothetical protein
MRRFFFLVFLACSMTGSAQTNLFDADGYYFPTPSLRVCSLNIEYLDLNTCVYYYEGKVHDQPKAIPPVVFIRVKGQKKSISASDILVNQDTLSFRFTYQGKTITFAGSFLDKRGKFAGRDDIIPQKTVLLRGKFFVTAGDSLVESKESSFTYWEGD